MAHPNALSGMLDAVRQIVSTGVVVEGGGLGDHALAHPIAEEEALPNAGDVRRREFRAGRLYARRALAQMGLRACTLPIGPGRAPVWPAGFTGSISHTRSLCIAVVGTTTAFRTIGFDMEEDAPLPDEIFARVTTREENGARRNLEQQLGDNAGTLLFVAKEAFYKMRFSVTGQFLDFGDVEVEFDAGAGAVRASLVGDGATFMGRFARREGMLFCYFDLPAERQGER